MAKDIQRFSLPSRTLISRIEEELESILHSEDAVAEIGVHLWRSGGKRLRPLLTFLSAQLFCPEDEVMLQPVLRVAAATELVHMATLVHDDILDEASFRRGYPTVSALWGDQTAVLAGDALLARALVLLADNAPQIVVRWMSQMVYDMCEGEVYQQQTRFNLQQTEETYRLRIEKKTGRFLAACCQAGAFMGGATAEQVETARQFGLHLGLAFQITDDVLDIDGDPELMGKPVGSDLAEGILTLPVLRALQVDKGEPPLAQLLRPDTDLHLRPDHVQEVLARVRKTDGVSYTLRQVESELRLAQQYLQALPEGEARDQLTALLGQMGHRRT